MQHAGYGPSNYRVIVNNHDSFH
ncbi:protein of unknown function [Paraburkholderia dioscoreae]|uniref:Uncharacterized protein n=1 Tax=Paraburkholderia dioscoreae TaxID=2604047 RepID=A0A5Q4YV81_9BURK|nr:protein of unknown function [Paraburkholderia dioscoreae]